MRAQVFDRSGSASAFRGPLIQRLVPTRWMPRNDRYRPKFWSLLRDVGGSARPEDHATDRLSTVSMHTPGEHGSRFRRFSACPSGPSGLSPLDSTRSWPGTAQRWRPPPTLPWKTPLSTKPPLFATTAAEFGAEERNIMTMTGHKTTQMVRRYIQEANLFKNNALNKIKI